MLTRVLVVMGCSHSMETEEITITREVSEEDARDFVEQFYAGTELTWLEGPHLFPTINYGLGIMRAMLPHLSAVFVTRYEWYISLWVRCHFQPFKSYPIHCLLQRIFCTRSLWRQICYTSSYSIRTLHSWSKKLQDVLQEREGETILMDSEVFWAVSNHFLSPSWSISVWLSYLGLSWAISDYPRQYQAITGYLGQFWPNTDYLKLLLHLQLSLDMISSCLWVSWGISGYFRLA